jgi:pyruvate formate lyase activating enzyme
VYKLDIKLLKHGCVILLVAFGGAVDVPKFNDDYQNIKETGEFLSSLKIAQVNLLPYHYLGTDKYRRLGRNYKLVTTPSPSEEKLSEISAILKKFNLNVKLRG